MTNLDNAPFVQLVFRWVHPHLEYLVVGGAGCREVAPRRPMSANFVRYVRKRFIEGAEPAQSTLFPQYLENWVDENNPVRVIDVFVDALDLGQLGFDDVAREATGRPSYHLRLSQSGSVEPPA